MESIDEKPEKSPQAMVAIDGAAARRIREAKKLTQLYVASVVGVTTDTISRWENNRYPSIKRDNAKKLASALEVPLDEILRQEEEPVAEEPPAETGQSRRKRLVTVIAAVLAAVAIVVTILVRPHGAPPAAHRKLPKLAAPASVIPVQIIIDRKDELLRGFVVKERLPVGWRLGKASPPPVAGSASADEVKWLVPKGSGEFVISYSVVVPPDSHEGTGAAFAGKIVASTEEGNATQAIGGDGDLVVGGKHWADRNGDGVIDDNEIMPAYYLTEEMKDFGLDWKTIEAIWSGKGYRWDPSSKSFKPIPANQ